MTAIGVFLVGGVYIGLLLIVIARPRS